MGIGRFGTLSCRLLTFDVDVNISGRLIILFSTVRVNAVFVSPCMCTPPAVGCRRIVAAHTRVCDGSFKAMRHTRWQRWSNSRDHRARRIGSQHLPGHWGGRGPPDRAGSPGTCVAEATVTRIGGIRPGAAVEGCGKGCRNAQTFDSALWQRLAIPRSAVLRSPVLWGRVVLLTRVPASPARRATEFPCGGYEGVPPGRHSFDCPLTKHLF